MAQDAFDLETRAMTASANALAARATLAKPTTAPEFQPATHVRAFADAFEQLGFHLPRLMAETGLRRADLDDPDALVPCSAMTQIIRAAAAERRFPNLGAHVGSVTPIGAYPLLDYLIVTADNVAGAVAQLVRYFHVTAAPLAWSVVHDGDFIRLVVEPGNDPFIALYETSLAVHHLRAETGGRLVVSTASLMFTPEDATDLERLLGCSVRAPQAWSGLEFSREMLALPLRRRDPELRRVLEGHATTVAARLNAVPIDPSTATAVRTVVATGFSGGVPSVAEVARRLSMSPRTLQRRLSGEGWSYEQLVDDERRVAAERLLADASLAISEIGHVLGFSEPSTFHRAFKRWNDMTPQEYRRARRSEQPI